MITFTETKPIKLPGKSSILITFKYSREIVDSVKQIPSAIYHKKLTAWEIPTTSLARAIEILTNYDDIEVNLIDNTAEENPDVEYELQEYKTTPYQYQKEAIQYGLNHDKFLLLDAPGLGKTLTMIYLAQELKAREGIEHCLIICGINTLKHNWKKEIETHSSLDCRILGERTTKKGTVRIGSVQERLEDLRNPIEEFFVVTNIQTIRDSNIVSAIKNGPNKFDMIVVDEIHTCVSGDTLINTDRGLIKIKCINQNDNVLSYNVVSNSLEYKKVLNTFKIPNSKKLLKLTILDDNGFEHSIKCTPEHKIYTHNRGFVEAQFLTCDDRIEIIKNQFITC